MRSWSSPYSASPLYAISVRHKLRAGAVCRIFESMVALSDTTNLMDNFLALPFPRKFMFGEQHDSISYLGHLETNGVELANIPLSGHFPMFSNAPEIWWRNHDFPARAEQESGAARAARRGIMGIHICRTSRGAVVRDPTCCPMPRVVL